jgi:hypothetical protein
MLSRVQTHQEVVAEVDVGFESTAGVDLHQEVEDVHAVRHPPQDLEGRSGQEPLDEAPLVVVARVHHEDEARAPDGSVEAHEEGVLQEVVVVEDVVPVDVEEQGDHNDYDPKGEVRPLISA